MRLCPLTFRSLSVSLIVPRHHLCPCFRHSDHSVSEWSFRVSDSLTRALARRLLEASGFTRVAACVSSYIRTRMHPVARVCVLSLSRLTLSRQRTLSRQCSLSLYLASRGTSLSRRATSFSPLASPLPCPLRRGSARLQLF